MNPDPSRRLLKWVVYSLLLVNFGLYVYRDIGSAAHTLGADPTLLLTLRAFATSIDLLAWFVLILFFELETGVLAGRLGGNGLRLLIHAVRLVCCVAILHSTFANLSLLRDYQAARPLPAMPDLCAYTDGSWSFLENRGYTTVDAGNCAILGQGSEFFAIDSEPVLTDRAGLGEARILAWTDLAESLSWLLVVLLTEIEVRMQARGINGGRSFDLINGVKAGLYVLIVGIACYWGSKGQLLYFWDEMLWVFGFFMIEGNVGAYRNALIRFRYGKA